MLISMSRAIVAAMLAGLLMYLLFHSVWHIPGLAAGIATFAMVLGPDEVSTQALLMFATFVIYCFLAFPTALILSRLSPRNIALYVSLAVIPGLLWELRFLVVGSTSSGFAPVAMGVATIALALPVALLVLHHIRRYMLRHASP